MTVQAEEQVGQAHQRDRIGCAHVLVADQHTEQFRRERRHGEHDQRNDPEIDPEGVAEELSASRLRAHLQRQRHEDHAERREDQPTDALADLLRQAEHAHVPEVSVGPQVQPAGLMHGERERAGEEQRTAEPPERPDQQALRPMDGQPPDREGQTQQRGDYSGGEVADQHAEDAQVPPPQQRDVQDDVEQQAADTEDRDLHRPSLRLQIGQAQFLERNQQERPQSEQHVEGAIRHPCAEHDVGDRAGHQHCGHEHDGDEAHEQPLCVPPHDTRLGHPAIGVVLTRGGCGHLARDQDAEHAGHQVDQADDPVLRRAQHPGIERQQEHGAQAQQHMPGSVDQHVAQQFLTGAGGRTGGRGGFRHSGIDVLRKQSKTRCPKSARQTGAASQPRPLAAAIRFL